MLTLSNHEHSGDIHAPHVAQPAFGTAEIDMHTTRTTRGTISASSMVSDFTSDGSRKVV
jgi:hypothetical protein